MALQDYSLQLHLSGLELAFPSFQQLLWQQRKGKSERFSMTFRHCSDNCKTSKIQSPSAEGCAGNFPFQAADLRAALPWPCCAGWLTRSGGPKQDQNLPRAVSPLRRRASAQSELCRNTGGFRVSPHSPAGCCMAALRGPVREVPQQRWSLPLPKVHRRNASGCATHDVAFPFGVFSFPSLLG